MNKLTYVVYYVKNKIELDFMFKYLSKNNINYSNGWHIEQTKFMKRMVPLMIFVKRSTFKIVEGKIEEDFFERENMIIEGYSYHVIKVSDIPSFIQEKNNSRLISLLID